MRRDEREAVKIFKAMKEGRALAERLDQEKRYADTALVKKLVSTIYHLQMLREHLAKKLSEAAKGTQGDEE